MHHRGEYGAGPNPYGQDYRAVQQSSYSHIPPLMGPSGGYASRGDPNQYTQDYRPVHQSPSYSNIPPLMQNSAMGQPGAYDNRGGPNQYSQDYNHVQQSTPYGAYDNRGKLFRHDLSGYY